MKFIDNKQGLSKFSLSFIWYRCESHWWCYTCQNGYQSHSRHKTKFAC